MMKHVCATIVTPTWMQPKQLIGCIEQVREQDFTLPYEHIIISDGHDNEAIAICNHYDLICHCVDKDPNPGNSKGHLPRDKGIEMASGRFVVLWDDDNIYYKHALSTLYRTTKNFDIGICNIYFRRHHAEDNEIYRNIPDAWDGKFCRENIDTMNVMVRISIARSIKWIESKKYAGDYYWLAALQGKGAKINYLPNCIGIKL